MGVYYGRMFWDYVKQYVKSRMVYRTDFFVEMVSDLLNQLVSLLFIAVVFSKIPALSGWSKWEVLFVYGYFLIPNALFEAFWGNLWAVQDRYIIKGEMDRILTRPVYSLFQILMETMTLESLSGVLTGAFIMVYSGMQLHLHFHWYDLLVLVCLMLGSNFVYGGIYVVLASIGFWSDSKTGIIPLVYNFGSYGRYPVDIYNRPIRVLLTWVLPFAFVGVYPAMYFLHKPGWQVWTVLTPVVGMISMAIGIWVWNAGIKRYRGAGS
jgi:ABC-2 type transport system permease protein